MDIKSTSYLLRNIIPTNGRTTLRNYPRESCRHGWIHAHAFVQHSNKVRQAIHTIRCDFLLALEMISDLTNNLFHSVGMFQQQISGSRQDGRGCLASGNEQQQCVRIQLVHADVAGFHLIADVRRDIRPRSLGSKPLPHAVLCELEELNRAFLSAARIECVDQQTEGIIVRKSCLECEASQGGENALHKVVVLVVLKTPERLVEGQVANDVKRRVVVVLNEINYVSLSSVLRQTL